MWGGTPVQPLETIRVLVYRLTINSFQTKCVKVDELEPLIKEGWRVFAVDPEDSDAYGYWTELGDKDRFRH